ncbi:MAG: transposase, partial [Lachnospiraceae bacterium]|nr:transposase [Lachnospiraceae bacterium]
ICLNPVNARIVELPEQYKWSSYSTLVGLTEEPITECDKTLRYFKDKNKQLYREFVESRIRYGIFEERIAKEMGEDELWLPW